jgi:hypothetical protein
MIMTSSTGARTASAFDASQGTRSAGPRAQSVSQRLIGVVDRIRGHGLVGHRRQQPCLYALAMAMAIEPQYVCQAQDAVCTFNLATKSAANPAVDMATPQSADSLLQAG